MNIAAYWKSKTKLLEDSKDIFKDWNLDDQITVRKMVISKIMDVTIDNISYFLNRDEWLKEFSLGNIDAIASHDYMKEKLAEKANEILKTVFYTKDAEDLLPLVNQRNRQEKISSPNGVCELIKELLIPETFKKLSVDQKSKVELYEKIYFEPIELMNGYIKEEAGASVYYTVLMEQWKTANEMAAKISEQRNTMNSFYISLMSILIGGILFSDQLLNSNIIAKTVLFITVAVTGGFVCAKWRLQIDNYGKLNQAKYEVINELERHLPANVMYCEWLRTEKNARKKKRKTNFSKQEKGIAIVFECVIIFIPLVMLVGIWWEEICRKIETVVQ